MSNIKVFHLDDDEMILWGVKSMLFEYEEIKYLSTTKIEELFVLLDDYELTYNETREPCVVLLDLNLYGIWRKGEDVLREIKDRFHFAKVIVLSIHLESNTNNVIIDLIKLGADGFAAKSIKGDDLKSLIHLVYKAPKGVAQFHLEHISALDEDKITEFSIKTNLEQKKENLANLTSIEKLIFKVACWGTSNQDIVMILRCLGCFIGLRNVEKHIEKCVNKLGYPRKSFNIYARLVGIDYEILAEDEIKECDFLEVKEFLEAKNIVNKYRLKTNTKGDIQDNIKDLLQTMQVKYMLRRNDKE